VRDVFTDDVVDDHVLRDVGQLVVVLASDSPARVVEQQVEVLVESDEVHFFLRHVFQKLRRIEEVHSFARHVNGACADSFLLVEVDV